MLKSLLLTALVAAPAAILVLATPPGRRLRRYLVAALYDRVLRRHEAELAERKRNLLGGLAGTVLEIGPGTGSNFRYLQPAVTRWIGVEANPAMRHRLAEKAARSGIATEIVAGDAAHLDLPDGSVDAVVATLVLCSVEDPERVLREVLRVLRPGGVFAFVEHVAAPSGTSLRRWQRAVRPVWSFLADGCAPDRETARRIAEVGFLDVAIEAFDVPRRAVPRLVAPHIAGSARKPQA
jgi:ubiquinone/menaquinone biosynthesis C-methylase UbiE